MLLALLILVLPTAALASEFDFPSGTFVSGTLSGMFATGRTVNISLVGSLNTIGIVTATMVQLPSSFCPGATCFKFTGGTVTVGPSGSILTNALASGLISTMGNEIGIAATLAPSSLVKEGSASFDFHFSGTALTDGEAGVQGRSTVPEPGTLEGLLLGMGVLGLADMGRRKLKLGTAD
jgi:hypothetical protein